MKTLTPVRIAVLVAVAPCSCSAAPATQSAGTSAGAVARADSQWSRRSEPKMDSMMIQTLEQTLGAGQGADQSDAEVLWRLARAYWWKQSRHSKRHSRRTPTMPEPVISWPSCSISCRGRLFRLATGREQWRRLESRSGWIRYHRLTILSWDRLWLPRSSAQKPGRRSTTSWPWSPVQRIRKGSGLIRTKPEPSSRL